MARRRKRGVRAILIPNSDKAKIVLKKTVSSLEETKNFGIEIAKTLSETDIVALSGELGAGKTTLIKSIASHYCKIDEQEISSPTFSYLHIYEGLQIVYHFDLYRLKGEKDFFEMGFFDFLHNKHLVLIEWPERISSLLPSKTINILISYSTPQSREIIVYHSL